MPVFLPFAGCRGKCVYCAQDKQTGQSGQPGRLTPDSLSRLLLETEENLRARPGRWELAFYGGTFTGLPQDLLDQCLEFARKMLNQGLAYKARCSTRPDELSPQILERVKKAGIGLIELGVQSFSDLALRQSARNYSAEQALQGCKTVREAGFDLGIQLLPGLPGGSPEQFLDDARQALELEPTCLRFYPCLVLEDTALAAWWRRGDYRPWSLEQTISILGKALALAWDKEVPVIRLSVAQEDSLEPAVLAGPRHPSLGGDIQAEALRLCAQRALDAFPGQARKLHLPRACQGFMYGHKGIHKAWWAERGLPPERIIFTDLDLAWLE